MSSVLTWLGTPLAVEDDEVAAFGHFLSQNYPNPFNPQTTIAFSIPQKERVSLQIYNASGQLVRTLIDGSMNAGPHALNWNGLNDRSRETASGIYFYQLKTDSGFEQSKRMILMK